MPQKHSAQQLQLPRFPRSSGFFVRPSAQSGGGGMGANAVKMKVLQRESQRATSELCWHQMGVSGGSRPQ